MQKYKRVVTGIVIGLMATFATVSAMADWSESTYSSGGYGWHHYSHYEHHDGNDLAAGLVVGGLVGVLAGSAMANSQPRYVEAPQRTCYRSKHAVWRHRFCDDDGCYVRTKWAWRTHCD